MFIGYARVSTKEQNPDLQEDELRRAGCERIFTEHRSSGAKTRPELETALAMLRAGDTFAVWRLDRLGRNLVQLDEITTALRARGVHFTSLTEKIDTSTSLGKLYFQLLGSFAEFERNSIRERTNAGLEAARARGRQGGRRARITPMQRQQIISLYKARETPIRDIKHQYRISTTTLYRILNEAGAAKGRAAKKV